MKGGSEMAESWYNDTCPKCGTKNWWCNGDESDLTRPDVDSIRCYKCKNIWSLEDRKIISEDDAYFCEDGQENTSTNKDY